MTALSEELASIGNERTCPTAVLVREGSILMGFRNYTKDKWKDASVWTTPGGRCDPGETIEQTLRREIKEEIGIDQVEIIDFIGRVPGAKEGDVVPIFFCTTDQEAQLMEPDKFSEWRWVPTERYIHSTEFTGFNLDATEVIIAYLKHNC